MMVHVHEEKDATGWLANRRATGFGVFLSLFIVVIIIIAIVLALVFIRPKENADRKPEPIGRNLAFTSDAFNCKPVSRDKWEIPRHEIKLLGKLGNGSFGDVFYGTWNNQYEVAVKTRRKSMMSSEEFLREAAVMKNLKHEHLVTLYGVCSEQEPIYIVQEYMSKGSLLQFLRTGEGKSLECEGLKYIAFQIASGMDYLESKNIIHRDLAARNVLIAENNLAKICDFGLARVLESEGYRPKDGKKFPVRWTAPEAIKYETYDTKSDVWSYGILLMEIFTHGQIPYPGMDDEKVIDRVTHGYRMPKPRDLRWEIYKIMLMCWNAIPKDRPSFNFLTNYFKN